MNMYYMYKYMLYMLTYANKMNKTKDEGLKLEELRNMVHLSMFLAIPLVFILLKLGFKYALGVSFIGYFFLSRVM